MVPRPPSFRFSPLPIFGSLGLWAQCQHIASGGFRAAAGQMHSHDFGMPAEDPSAPHERQEALPVQSKIRAPLFAARTLNATGQYRVTLSLL